MAQSQNTRRPAPQKGLQWFTDAGNRIDQLKREAEARGRQIYEEAIRRGVPIVAKTTEDIRELGAKAIHLEQKVVRNTAKFGKEAVSAVKHPHSAETQRFVRNLKDQTKAAAHGAGDTFTFGLADKASAGVRALVDSGGNLSEVGDLYHEKIEGERAQDQYETENFGGARLAGQVAGTVAQMAALGPLAAPTRVMQVARALPVIARGGGLMPELSSALRLVTARRVPGAAGLILKEQAGLGAIGAGTGVVSQGVNDLAHHQLGSGGDYLGAAAGGALQGVTAPRMGPGANAALGGAVTSSLQDIANGRPISTEDAAIAALTGGAIGKFAGQRASRAANNLSVQAKGRVGEKLSEGRSLLRWQLPTDTQARIQLNNRRTTVADHVTRVGPVEAKFGPTAKLSRNQRAAAAQFGEDYRIDSFLPEDVGRIVGSPLGQLASQVLDRESYDQAYQDGVGGLLGIRDYLRLQR
jgi:hypothetical protein